MKKKLILIGFVIMFISCTKEELSDYYREKEFVEMPTKSTGVFNLEDSIKEINVDEELLEKLRQLKQQKKSAKSPYGINEVLSENLYALRGHPFYLKSTFNNSYLTVTGFDTEAKLLYIQRPSIYQQFYLKVLPASTGIPYLLYSKSTNTPLSVGYWTSNPSRKILYPLSSDNPNYNSSWDIFPARVSNYEYKANGAVVLESQSYLGSIPDDPWGVYNYVVNATTDTEIGYSKYHSDVKQEFKLRPSGEFKDDSIRFEKGYNYNLLQISPKIVTLEESNIESFPKYFDFELDIVVNESVRFKDLPVMEYTLSRNGNNLVSVAYPSINADGDVNLEPEKGNNSLKVNYYNKAIQSVDRRFKHVEPVYLRPGKKLIAEFNLQRYKLEVDYRVYANQGSLKIKTPGILDVTLYSGVAEVIVYEEDLQTKSRRVVLTKTIKNL